MKYLSRTMILAAVCVLSSVNNSAYAADPVPIQWKATATSAKLPLVKGASVEVHVDAAILTGWRLYALEQQPGGPAPTSLRLVAGQPLLADGQVRESSPDTEFDSNFNLPTSIFEGRATFWMKLRAARAIPMQESAVKIDVAFQTCNDRMCLPLTVVHLTTPVHAARAR